MSKNTSTASATPIHYFFPTNVHLQWDGLEQAAKYIQTTNARILLIHVQNKYTNHEHLNALKENLTKHIKHVIFHDETKEKAKLEDLNSLAYFAKECRANFIIGYGDRESLNAARTTALLCTNYIFAEDLFAKAELADDINEKNKKLPLPCMTIPTGPQMGEEVLPNLCVHNTQEKISYYSYASYSFPQSTLIDPCLSQDLSPLSLARITMATLAIAIESIVSRHTNDIITAYGTRAVELITQNIAIALQDVTDKTSIQNLCMASLFAGMAYSNSGLGLNYALGSSIHDLTGCDFYTAINIMLPYVMEYNLTNKAEIYIPLTRIMGHDTKGLTVIEAAIQAIETIRKLYIHLKMPRRLSEINIEKADLLKIAEQTIEMKISRNNPREISQENLESILQSAH